MSVLVLDAEAISALATRGSHTARARAALEAASRLNADVVVPAAVLAECYRDQRHIQSTDALLSREHGLAIVPTDRQLARTVGRLLARAGAGSELHVDACVAAAGMLAGGGTLLTGDPRDLGRLTHELSTLIVEAL